MQNKIIINIPDLTVSALSASTTSAGNGEAITITSTTMNSGAVTAGSSRTGFYLSTDNILDASDTSIGYDSVNSLSAGGSEPAGINYTIPSSLPLGTYYVIAKADSNNLLSETSETNNTRSIQINVGLPDMTVTSLTTDRTAYAAGETATINVTTKNTGTSGAGHYSETRFYLSTDTAMDSSDLYLGYDSVGKLTAGASESANVKVIMPKTLPAGPGTYYILGVADADANLKESNENNNIAISQTSLDSKNIALGDNNYHNSKGNENEPVVSADDHPLLGVTSCYEVFLIA